MLPGGQKNGLAATGAAAPGGKVDCIFICSSEYYYYLIKNNEII